MRVPANEEGKSEQKLRTWAWLSSTKELGGTEIENPKSIGPLAAIIITLFYLLELDLLVTIKTHKKSSVSVCTETLHGSTSQHILLLVGFDTLIYRKYYNRSLILMGHQWSKLFNKLKVNKVCMYLVLKQYFLVKTKWFNF